MQPVIFALDGLQLRSPPCTRPRKRLAEKINKIRDSDNVYKHKDEDQRANSMRHVRKRCLMMIHQMVSRVQKQLQAEQLVGKLC